MLYTSVIINAALKGIVSGYMCNHGSLRGNEMLCCFSILPACLWADLLWPIRPIHLLTLFGSSVIYNFLVTTSPACHNPSHHCTDFTCASRRNPTEAFPQASFSRQCLVLSKGTMVTYLTWDIWLQSLFCMFHVLSQLKWPNKNEQKILLQEKTL